jgi:3-phenylpropionate/trans-cinnamate dioxygenase ferredoxin reductase subunit
LQIAGFNRGYDRTTVSHGTAEGSMTVSYFQGERLIAVDCLNDARSFMLAKCQLCL